MLEAGLTFCQSDSQSKRVVNNSALPLLALEGGSNRYLNYSVTFFFSPEVKFPNYSNFVEVLQQFSLIRDLNSKRAKMTIHSGNA